MKNILNRKKLNPSIPTFTGVRIVDEVNVQLFSYNKENCVEKTNFSLVELKNFQEDEYRYWLNIHGIHDVTLIKNICLELNIHDLVVQDIVDINQRPKFQEYDKYWFFTLKSILPSSTSEIEQEQLSFILTKNLLVSFQERKADYFDHIRERLRKNIGIVRERSSDYLLYLLLESILDNYFKKLNEIEVEIEKLVQLNIDTDPSPAVMKIIETYKRQVHKIKKTIIPIKEFVTKIEREEFNFINKKHIKYFYELKDLCLSLIDECEYIEVKLESHTNLFFSIQGNRMNHVVRTLTVVSTIFIPLTFIAGIYGMNFLNMPELKWKWGYPALLLFMITILIGMIVYFKRKKWF